MAAFWSGALGYRWRWGPTSAQGLGDSRWGKPRRRRRPYNNPLPIAVRALVDSQDGYVGCAAIRPGGDPDPSSPGRGGGVSSGRHHPQDRVAPAGRTGWSAAIAAGRDRSLSPLPVAAGAATDRPPCARGARQSVRSPAGWGRRHRRSAVSCAATRCGMTSAATTATSRTRVPHLSRADRCRCAQGSGMMIRIREAALAPLRLPSLSR